MTIRRVGIGVIVTVLLVTLIVIARNSSTPWQDCKNVGTLALTNGDIYTVNTDGTNWRRLTKLDYAARRPVWSPDGQKIMFSVFEQSTLTDNIFVINADGTDLHRLTTYQSPYSATDGVWSADGRKIVFSLYWLSDDGLKKEQSYMATRTLTPNADLTGTPIPPKGNFEIFSMDTNGTNLQNLTQTSYDEFSPSWSPGNKQIVFTSNGGNTLDRNQKLYLMNADGSQQHLLLSNVYAYNPQWSPNGDSNTTTAD